MSLVSTAQFLTVMDQASANPDSFNLVPLEVVEPHASAFSPQETLEIAEPVDIQIVVEELPGAPDGSPEPLIVEEGDLHEGEKTSDKDSSDKENDVNDAKKKNDKWNWAQHGAHGFVAWIKERVGSVPKHSGQDTAGLERALAYLEKLDSEISKAMRLDLDEELDANKIEEVRADLEDGMDRLHARLEKIKRSKKVSRKKKADELVPEGFTKEAQKIMGVGGIYIMAPLFISRLARVCINDHVSAGHDLADLYKRQVERWKLTDREQAELQQLLFDMGFTLRTDRGYLNETLEVNDEKGMDWSSQWNA